MQTCDLKPWIEALTANFRAIYQTLQQKIAILYSNNLHKNTELGSML
jgi:hypothetical protein